ncbi:MAG: UbiA family prenyltransferase [Euryarchaeota archaeon]|nr:UbiA family prenyltransferase [Euryarchaeota archaeon]
MGLVERFITRLENIHVPVWGFLALLLLAGSLRYYFEVVFFHITNITLLKLTSHLTYFVMLYLFTLFALKLFTDEKVAKIAPVMTVSLPALVLPPIVDHFIFGRTAPYMMPTTENWARMALTFFQSDPSYMSHGHQVEFAVLMALVAMYIYVKLKGHRLPQRIAFSLSATFTIYMSLFVLMTPSLWLLIRVFMVSPVPPGFKGDYPYIVYNFSYILVGFLSFWLAIIAENPRKVWKLLKDASPPRILHFSLMFVLGYFVQMNMFAPYDEIYWRGNLLMLIIGVFSAASAWAFVVGINNYYDKSQDKLTNTFRGLTTGEYTDTNLLDFVILALAAGAFTAYLLGPWSFLFYFIFVLLGYVYSYPRIHLKKYGTKTIIIGLGSSFLFAMGYFAPWLANKNPMDLRFWIYFAVLFIVFSAGSVMNDLKDVDSDKKHGIRTIFTYFGKERGKKVGAALLVVAFSVPSILAPAFTPAFLALAALAAYFLMIERVLFIYMVYFAEYFLILFFHTL